MTALGDTAPFGGAYAGRRVLVTGHTGFKGSWLSRWLLDLGAQVTGYALDPPTDPSLFEVLGLDARLDHHVGDVRDRPHLARVIGEAEPEIVFHLAAQPLVRRSYDEPVETFETNIMGTVNLMEAVRATPSVRAVLNVTSDKCYENRETGAAYCEGDALGGYDPYSASKACSEIVTAAYRQSFFGDGAAAVATARAGNVIGGGDWAEDRIVPDCARALVSGHPVVVRNPGSVRPWQHVLECTSGYLLLGSRLLANGHVVAGAFNFGPAAAGEITVGELAEAFIAEWGSGSWTVADGGAGQPHEARLLALDCAKAAAELDWRPVWDARRALRETAAWYRSYYGGDGPGEELTSACLAAYVADARAAGLPWAG